LISCQDTRPPRNYDLKNKSTAGFVPFVAAEVLHGGKVFKKKDYRKESTGATTG
jgi:hypothetical protein